jgi:mitochondrial cardiolipin hydrolase
MTPQEVDAWLARSLEDRRLSRNERQALTAFLAELGPGADLDLVRRLAFEVAGAALVHPDDRPVLAWLEDVVKAIRPASRAPAQQSRAEAHFSPGEDCPRAIRGLLHGAGRSADICVFTITDDRLADAILDAHGRGVAVRIITDNQKAEDVGSDIGRFQGAGIAVRVDRSPFHMHHKFAILDGSTLLTGSYNWTRGAARDNEENLVVTDEPRLASRFAAVFERLWSKLG